MENIHQLVKSLILRKKSGKLIYPTDFYGIANDSAIKKTLSRLAKEGIISRLAHGVYYIPKKDLVLGNIRPTIDEVINMLAKKEKIKIKPTGAFALHQLGLTTQVPTKRIYITDGSSRIMTIGKQIIKFKKTVPKKLSMLGPISGLIIQGLEELGTEHISDITKRQIRNLLDRENPKNLQHDLKLAPAKINNYIVSLLKETLLYD